MIFGVHFFLDVLVAVLVCVGIYLMFKQRRRYRASVAVLEDASDTIGNGLICFDKKDRFVSANSQAREFLPELIEERGERFGQSKGPVLSAFLDYMYDHAVECDESLFNTLGRSAEKMKDAGFREVILAPGSRYCLVEARKTDAGGTYLILIDIGDLKNQEDRMLRLNEYNYELDQAIQATTSGVVVMKYQAEREIIVFANSAFCEIWGVERQGITGQDLEVVFSKIDDDEALEAIFKIRKERKTGTVELKHRDANNEEHWYELKMSPVKGFRGEVALFVGVFNDITELKMRQAELSKAQKLEALGQLSAGVAHDFNNVLSIIDGYSRLTSTAVGEDPKIREYQGRIQTATQRGANLIKQMLTFSRHEIVQDTVIDLGQAVQEQQAFLQPLVDASIKFKVLSDVEQMIVECSVDGLTQILMNLVVNARDAMPDGGTLLVESRACPSDTLPKALLDSKPEGGYACLLVSDTGTGMKQEIIDRIFDPFFTTKDQGKGTGLGLSMVYGLVKQIGGHIDIDSKIGRGTSIMIYLPLTDKALSRQVSGDLRDVDTIRFDGFTAMVAEDEPDLLLLVRGILEDLGMNVLTARDGHEALAVQDDYEGSIDLLLTDVVMPELGGVELADLMEDLRPEAGVIYMSGYPANGQNMRVDLPDDAVFIAKPIKHDDLIRLIYAKLNSGSHSGGVNVETPRWAVKKEILQEEISE